MVERRTHKPKVKGSIPFLATIQSPEKVKRRLPFEILYEDRDLVVIDKPEGLLTTHTRVLGRVARESQFTAENILTDYLRKGQARSRNRAWLVHRLDRGTSGVLVFAKSEAVAENLREHWNEVAEKTYIARVEGHLDSESGVFESYLRDDPRTFKVSSVRNPADGKFARTLWRRISEDANSTLVEVKIETGRKNQIRVHFSEAGHPIVGDVKYGAHPVRRLMLHSMRLVLKIRPEPLTFVAPPHGFSMR